MTTRIQPQRGVKAMPPYKPGTPIEEVRRKYGLTDVIKLASNESPLGPSPKALEAIERALHRLNFYPDAQSYDLRLAIAQHLGFDLEQVAVGNGADGIIMQLCMAYLEEDSEVVVSRSSFPVYDRFAHVMRATLVKTPLKDFCLDLEAMAGAITDKTKLVIVCNPNNPTGTIVTAAELDAFMRQVPEYVLVVFDEAYYEYVDDDAYPDTLAYVRDGRRNALTMRTLSKAYGLAGIRLGFAVSMPEILAPMFQVKGIFEVNLLAQAAGIAALDDEAYVRRSVEANRDGLNYFYGEFGRLGLNFVRGCANFVLVEIGPEALAVQERLLERGVIVRPCTHYDLPHHLRISVGDAAQNARLVEALEEILKVTVT